MSELIAVASAILSDAARSVETSAQNVANITTPGYKRRADFSKLMDPTALGDEAGIVRQPAIDFSAGKIVETNNPYDLAVTGDGFLAVRTASGSLVYTRDGQFTRDGEGRLVDARGAVLQADGRDLSLTGTKIEIQKDGTILEDGTPSGRLDLMKFVDRATATPADGGAFAATPEAMTTADSASVRQGAVEMSNVSTAAEMVSIMAAMRRAETGQRLATVYDDLMSRVISSFGQV
jgi:flagellar basal-body rod protein FlgG